MTVITAHPDYKRPMLGTREYANGANLRRVVDLDKEQAERMFQPGNTIIIDRVPANMSGEVEIVVRIASGEKV